MSSNSAVNVAGSTAFKVRRHAFSEIELVIVAVGVWAAAWLSLDVPPLPGLLCIVLAVAVRRRLLMAAGLVLLASALGANAEAAYHDSTSEGYVADSVTVMSDVRALGYGSRVEAALSDGRRVELIGYGSEGFALAHASIGSSLEITGTIRTIGERPWLKNRHIVGRVSLNSVGPVGKPPLWRLPPEWLRSLVSNGSEVLSDDDQALYTGLVIGDDRFQTADQKAQFQVAGLTHLLAVSGQNVAFVLAVLSPGLLRLKRSVRWLAILIALAVFALATRAEPSVLRATVSVGLATSLTLLGFKTSGIRIVSLVSVSLLYVDPFLARSVGFQLSVAASAGILLLGPILQRYQRLPALIWTPLSVTLSAQLAVAPLLLIYFGRLGLVSIPANLVAGWAAGAVMMWGLTAGVVAGLLPTPLAEVLQLPVMALLWWIKTVASFSSRIPSPVLTSQSALPVAGLLSSVVLTRKYWHLRIVMAGALLFQLMLLVPNPPQIQTDIGHALYLPSSDDEPSVLIVRSDASDQLVTWVTENRILEIDIIVFEQGDRRASSLASALQNVADIQMILAPSQHSVVGAHRVIHPTEVESSVPVLIEATEKRLKITVEGRPI